VYGVDPTAERKQVRDTNLQYASKPFERYLIPQRRIAEIPSEPILVDFAPIEFIRRALAAVESLR
jgi:hypothetical protein